MGTERRTGKPTYLGVIFGYTTAFSFLCYGFIPPDANRDGTYS